MAKNIFDQFDTDLKSDAPTLSKNVFDQFDDGSNTVTADQFKTQIMDKVKNTKDKPKDIMAWSEASGQKINQPKAFSRWVELVRKGKTDDIPFEFENDAWRVPAPALKSGKMESFGRQALQGVTMDFGDEIEAWRSAGGLMGYLANPDWESNYMRRWNELDAKMRGDYEYNPKSSYAGYGVGMVGGMFLPGQNIARTASTAQKIAKSAAAGGVYSGIATAGQNTPDNRFENVPSSVVVGGAAGPLVEPVVRGAGRVAGIVADKTGLTDALDVASVKLNNWARKLGVDQVWDRLPAEIKQFATRAKLGKPEVERMAEAVQVARRAGIDPRTVDVMSRSEQDIVAAAGRADKGAGRDRLYEQAKEQARTIGSDVVGQFKRVTNVDANARELGEKVTQRRDYRATRAMNAMRDQPLELDLEIVDVLNTQVGRSAVRAATRAQDPETAEAMRRLPELMQQLGPLAPSAREQVLRQTPHKFTVGMADRIRIALRDAEEAARRAGRGGEAREIAQLRQTITRAATRTDPAYAEYLAKYGEDSRTLEAIETGRQAFDRNTDEFVDEATALSDAPNAVLFDKDMAPSTGEYRVIKDEPNPYIREGHRLVIERKMPDGAVIRAHAVIDPRGELADTSIFSIGPDGREYGFGDPAGYNRYGPEVIEDFAKFFRERFGDRFPRVRGVTGGRVGGAREFNESFSRQRAHRERQQRETPPPAGSVDSPAVAATEQDRQTARAMFDEYQDSIDRWEDSDDFLEEMYNLGGPPGSEPPLAILQEFNNLVRGRHDPTAAPPGWRRVDPGEEQAARRVEAEIDAENLAGYESRTGYNADATADSIVENLTAHSDGAQPMNPTTMAEIRDILGSHASEADMEDEGFELFARSVMNRVNQRIEQHNVRNFGGAVDDVTGAPLSPDIDVERTSNGLTWDEVRSEYEQTMQFYDPEDGPRPTFEQWARDNFFENEMPQSFWERIRGAAGRLAGDESGAKRLPPYSEVDPLRAPSTDMGLPSAQTGPPGGGVQAVGPSTRMRNERPAGMPTSYSFHPTTVREKDTLSDRQLAVAEAGRELERRVGEGRPGRAGLEMGSRMMSPEQQARNEALMGRETAASLNRAMDATLRQAETTARLNPGAGSPTAIRQGDDAALGQMMEFFGNAMTGGKAGVMNTIMTTLKGGGMTDKQVESMILRMTDPNQTDQVVAELSKFVNGPDNARHLIALIRTMQQRAIAGASSTEPEM
jgi:hypothetical protein